MEERLQKVLANSGIDSRRKCEQYILDGRVKVNGIVINRSITINGNGHTINANNQARIFNVTNYVNFNNIVFRNAYADSGAAITGSNYAVSNCRFISNDATS